MVKEIHPGLSVETNNVHPNEVISVTKYGHKISVGVRVLVIRSGLGPRQWSIGKIVSIEHPEIYRTDNIYGIDFENCGYSTAHLNVNHFRVLTINQG